MKKTIIALTMLMFFVAGCSQNNVSTPSKVEGSKVSKMEKDSKENEEKNDDSKKAKETSKENEKDTKETVSVSESQKKDKTETSSSSQSKDTSVKEPKKESSKPSNTTSNSNNSSTSKQDQVTPPPVEEKVETPVKQTAMANDVMAKINAYRQQNGLQPLQSTSGYQAEADAHALEMAQARALWHGDNGECITNHPDPFNAWINSPEHKAIILTPNNTQGVVSIYYVDGYYYSVFRTSW